MNAPSATGSAPVNGISMYYEVYGSGGMPLVLVHGGGSTIQSSFSTVIPLLSESRTVIGVELDAHGRTTARPGGSSFEQDADDVAAFLRFLGIPEADLLGFSNGANTCLQVAIRHPSLVHKLVAASAFYKRSGMMTGFFDGLQQASLADLPDGLRQAFLAVTPDPKRLQIMFDKDRNRMLEFRDWSADLLMQVKAPTLVLAADHDVMTAAHSVEMAGFIPGARVLIVPGTHGSYLGEMGSVVPGSKIPEWVSGFVLEFLSREAGAPETAGAD